MLILYKWRNSELFDKNIRDVLSDALTLEWSLDKNVTPLERRYQGATHREHTTNLLLSTIVYYYDMAGWVRIRHKLHFRRYKR